MTPKASTPRSGVSSPEPVPEPESRRVGLERLITRLANHFVNLSVSDIDAGIEYALGELGRFTGADRCEIYRLLDEGAGIRCEYEWCTDTLEPRKHLLPDLPTSAFAWGTASLLEKRRLYIPDVRSTCDERKIDPAVFERWGTRSLIALPLVYDGKVSGVLSLLSRDENKAWEDELLALESVSAEMFANALEKKRAAQVQLELESFRDLLLGLANHFINLPPADTEPGIDLALAELGKFARADRCEIYLYDQDREGARLAHEWCGPGIEPRGWKLGDRVPETYPWSAAKIRSGELLHISSVSELGAEAQADRERMEKDGSRSIIAVPLACRGEVRGALSLVWMREERGWGSEPIPLLKASAEMLCHALQRRETEEALREAESRYRSLLRSDIVGIWIGNRDGRMLEANDIVRRKLGFSAEDLATGRARWDRMLTPQYAANKDRTLELLDEFQYVGPWPSEVFDADGRPFPVLIGLTLLEGHPDRFLAVTHDMTELKQVEHELRYRSELERLVARLATRFISLPVEDLDRGITSALEELAGFIGVDRAEIYIFNDDGLTVSSAYEWCESGRNPRKHRLQDVNLSSFAWVYERMLAGRIAHIPNTSTLRKETGSDALAYEEWEAKSFIAVPLITQSRTIGSLCFISHCEERTWEEGFLPLLEICAEMFAHALERKRLQQELDRFNRRHESILDAAGEGIYGLDLEGRATFVNRAATAMFGWSAEEIIGRSAHALIHHSKSDGSPYPEHECPIYAVLVDGVMRTVTNELLWRKDGSSFPAEYVSAPLLEHGVPVGAVVVFRDVSDRVHAQTLERKHRAELAHALRLSTMGEMAAGLAHELNQPLLAISNYARGCERRLRASGDVDASVLGAVERISAQTVRAADIIKSLRNYANKAEPRRMPTDLNALLHEAVGLLRAEAKENEVRIETDLDVALPEIMADSIQVEQVIVNLIRNAVEALGGVAPERRRICVSSRRLGREILLAVSDQGDQAAVGDVEKIFEPFFTTKDHGLGLGLSISRSIVESHGGRLWAEPAASGGMIFSLALPLLDAGNL